MLICSVNSWNVESRQNFFSRQKPNSESCIEWSFYCKNDLHRETFGWWCYVMPTMITWRIRKVQNFCDESCNQCNFQNFILLSRKKVSVNFTTVQDFTLLICKGSATFEISLSSAKPRRGEISFYLLIDIPFLIFFLLTNKLIKWLKILFLMCI